MQRNLTVVGLSVLLVSLALAAGATAKPSDEHPGELEPAAEQRSLAFEHVRYVQTIDGLPVQDGVAAHHVPLDGGEAFWTHALADGAVSEQPLLVGASQAVEIAEARADVDVPMPDHEPTVRLVWAEDGDKLVRAHEVHVPSLSPPALWRVTVDAHDGEVLTVEDRSMHLERPARVFDVNPIVALQDPEFRDNPASLDNEALQEASATVTIENLREGPGLATDTFRIVDSATTPQANDNLTFRREDPRFVEASALAWLQHGNARIEDAGFDQLLDETIDVYVHQPSVYIFRTGGVPPVFVFPAVGPDAYSMGGELHFLYRTLSVYGDGMGSAAEDADTVFHELGHELLFAANPSIHGDLWADLHEGSAMIFGMLLQPSHVPEHNRACEGEWLITYYEDYDGLQIKEHDGFPCLRVLDNDKTMEEFDADGTGSQTRYENGEILAGAVWDLGQRIGWDQTLALYTEAAHLFPEEPDNFHDIGEAVARADCAMTECARLGAIQEAFGAHGIDAEPPEDVNLTATEEAGSGSLDTASVEDDGMLGVPGSGSALGLAMLALVALARRRC